MILIECRPVGAALRRRVGVFSGGAVSMKYLRTSLFLDTNSLLHYPSIKDVDWLNVCDSEAVVLVLCMQVVHELDEKKSDAKLRSRAERVLRDVEAMETNQQGLRHGVSMETFLTEPRHADFPPSLSPDS